MSRDPYPQPEDESLHDLARAAERIADALDDYLRMSLSMQLMAAEVKGADPDLARALAPLTEVMAEIAERRHW